MSPKRHNTDAYTDEMVWHTPAGEHLFDEDLQSTAKWVSDVAFEYSGYDETPAERRKRCSRPIINRISRNSTHCHCPRCRRTAKRTRTVQRRIHGLGDSERSLRIVLTFSQHYCEFCKRYFNANTSDIAPPGSRYTCAVKEFALALVLNEHESYRKASCLMQQFFRVYVPPGTICNWIEELNGVREG